MTPEQALQLLATVTPKLQVDLQTHQAIQQAIKILHEKLTSQNKPVTTLKEVTNH